jgi:hypothetical protein
MLVHVPTNKVINLTRKQIEQRCGSKEGAIQFLSDCVESAVNPTSAKERIEVKARLL